MNCALLPLVLLLGFGPQSTGDDRAERLGLAREIAALTNDAAYNMLIDQLMGGGLRDTVKQLLPAVIKREPTPADLDAATRAIRLALLETHPRAEWDEAIAQTVAEYLTASELRELLAFHRSPLGKRVLAMQERLMADGAAMGERLLGARGDALMQALARELRKTFPQ